ncbi:MAG: AMP-binding protein [Pseudomonadota bacterium]
MAVMTLAEAAAHVTSTDPRFALGRATIRGVDLPVFANAPASLRDVMAVGAAARAELPDGGDYIIYEGERITYAAWQSETFRIAHALVADLSVQPGDRVAIAMRNYPEYLSLMMAIASVGAVVVMVNAWWTTDELRYGFEDSGAKIVFADGPRADSIRPFAAEFGLRIIGVRDGAGDAHYDALLAGSANDAPPDIPIDPDADFAVMYSSGTTGHPKGVVLTHRGAITALYSWFMGFSLMPLMVEEMPPPTAARQTLLVTTPFFHITATHPCFLLSLPLGAKIVLMHKWDPEKAVRLVEAEEVTRFLAVPTMSADLTDAAVRMGATLKTLSNLSAGGAKRPAAQVLEQDKALPHVAIASGYGMTESNALGLGISGPEYAARPESAGRLYPPIQEIKIADEAGDSLPNGEVGEICLKSATIMRCYLNKPEATAEVLRDGWLHTGDLGRIDDEGYVEIVDRKKNIIIRGGENISCLEVEGAIHKHPAVTEAAVFPVPHERLNETVGAAVQLKPGAHLGEDELRDHLAPLLAKFKWPEQVWWTGDTLIRGATDKTDRRAIRAACLEGRL